MAETIKTHFTWDDRDDPNIVDPCEYCKASDFWPLCDDRATTSACNHCLYNIILYCLDHWEENFNY